jgi:uncharacterized membrane protein/predicted DsbA family dithiol-disulfide isomerase
MRVMQPRWSNTALFMAFAGLFAAGVLSVAHVLDLPIPCGRNTGCGAVALDPSSRFLGVPIALFGVAAYLAIIFLLALSKLGRPTRIALVALTGTGTVISAGLLIYAHAVIHATCMWCVASGIAMTLLFILSIFMVRSGDPVAVPKPTMAWSFAVVTALALGVQTGYMQKKPLIPPLSASGLAVFPAAELIDPNKSLGPEDAPITIIEFFDLSCWGCWRSYDDLRKYQQDHPDRVRLVYRHLPLWELRGHEFSRAAAALSEMAGEQGRFWEFLDAVHQEKRPLKGADYLELMKRLNFNPDEIEARLSDPNDPAIARVLRDEQLAERLGIQATPAFIVSIEGHPPVSASAGGLARLLNSPSILSRLNPEMAHSSQTVK